MLEFTTLTMTYTSFCEAVVRAGHETAIAIKNKLKNGTLQANPSFLQPSKRRINHSADYMRNKTSPCQRSTLIQQQLKRVNKRNRNLVDLAKAQLYSGICTNIHNMRMNLRLVWENMRLLTGRETAHHKTTINMAIKLENGNLASYAKENMSIFGVHFHKVLNTHRPIDKRVLDLITQKPCLTVINAPITLKEVKHTINKLKRGKTPGLNGTPLEALKAMDNAPHRTVHKHVSDFF